MLGDWVAGKGRNLTDIFITHGRGDHWFAAGLLAERFGAHVVASAGTITQMRGNVATRPLLWDKLYAGIPPSPVTAVTVPDNRFTLEGRALVIVEVGESDRRLLQRQDRAGPGPPRADDPVSERQRALWNPRTPRGRRPQDHSRLLAVNRQGLGSFVVIHRSAPWVW